MDMVNSQDNTTSYMVFYKRVAQYLLAHCFNTKQLIVGMLTAIEINKLRKIESLNAWGQFQDKLR